MDHALWIASVPGQFIEQFQRVRGIFGYAQAHTNQAFGGLFKGTVAGQPFGFGAAAPPPRVANGPYWLGFDIMRGIAINATDEAFVTGLTNAAAFPTTPGAFDTTYNGSSDAFVARFNSAGTALVYSTFLGGSADDFGRDIAVNAASEAFVTGFTTPAVAAFPTTVGAYDTSHNGGYDAFITRLSDAGTALV